MAEFAQALGQPPNRRRDAVYRRRVSWFILLSLLVHAMVVGLRQWSEPPEDASQKRPETPLKVKTARMPAPQQQQIVDAPPVENETPPPDEALLGRKDQRVDKEQVARELGRAENAGLPDAPLRERPNEQQPDNLERFIPDPVEMAARGHAETSRQRNAVDREVGPLTLLNTKSSPFADYLIDRGYRALRLLTINAELTAWYRGEVGRLQLPAAVEVHIDPEGILLASSVAQSSGVGKVDNLLLNALRGAVRGRKPPAEAVEQGRVAVVLVLERSVLKIGIRD